MPTFTATTSAMLERLEQLKRSIAQGPRPSYHAFEHQGTRLVYDLLTGTLLEPGAAAFEILRSFEEGIAPAELAERLAGEAPEQVDAALSDLERLQGAGLFRTEGNDSPELGRRVVRELADHHPRKMMLMVQSNCNLKCSYCYEVANGFHSTGKRMDLETGKRSIEFLIQRSGSRRDVEVTFFGGEPLLNFPLIRELVEYCKTREPRTGKRFQYQITTNATLLDDEVIAFLVEHQFGVMLSIDGPPELHDIHRRDLGGHGTGSVALENARRLVVAQKRNGVRPAMVRVTMTHENHDGRALSRYFEEQGFERVMLGASSGRIDRKDDWDLRPEDVEELHGQGEDALEEYLAWIDGVGQEPERAGEVVHNLKPILDALRSPDPSPTVRCGVGRNMQAVTRDGRIYPCHRYAGDDAYQLGTIEEGIDPVKVEAYYERLLQVKERHCSHCWARITCGGQCPWYISKSTGEIVDPDDESCNGIRRGHERQLWLVHQLARRGKLGDACFQGQDSGDEEEG